MEMQNHAMDFIGLISFLCYMFINISLTSGQVCSDIGNFTTNSSFGRNRDMVLSSLASNVRQNGGFYNTTIGEGPDKVYGLALCTAETTLDACFDCVNSAVEDIKEKCTNQKEAIKFGCIVRYSNRSFLGNLELTPMESDHNLQDITSNLTEFDQIWQGLMDHLATEASMASSRLKMATGEANLTYLDKIYSIMQCTPDMSQRNCDFCLRQSMSYFQSCCHGKQGGYIQRPNCIFRWDLFPFYESIANAPPQSPLTDALPPLTGPVLPPLRLTKGSGGIGSVMIVIIVVSIVIFLLVVVLACVLLRRKNLKQQIGPESDQEKKDDDEIDSNESLQFNFNTISAATNNFSLDNKLGQGGFGIVYKGQLPDGRDIAVKRLSLNSRQGEREFKTESLLVAKLQHRNLVRLLGFCFQGSERLLIYEFVHNSSLDSFIFDPIKRLLLNWETRYKIIQGIARGLLYLHEDSRLRVIHRDLKTSNILLDRDLNPKISDFGLARLFDVDQTQCNTRRIVGTFGYMAPEYLTNGQFSIKSDVFSFGMLALEIISGQKNNKTTESENLITYAWEKWRRDKALDLIDPALTIGSCNEMLRCIHIALLCIQHNVADRPTMASVVLALTGASTSLPVPSKPAFLLHDTRDHHDSDSTAFQPKSKSTQFTVNEASITELDPR